LEEEEEEEEEEVFVLNDTVGLLTKDQLKYKGSN
jgi:hypothetical protein